MSLLDDLQRLIEDTERGIAALGPDDGFRSVVGTLYDQLKASVREVALEEVDQKNSDMLEQMLDGCGPIRRGSKTHEMIYGQGVLASSEFRRIQALPRRQLDMTLAQGMTEKYGMRTPCDGCSLCHGKKVELLPIQAAMLADVVEANGAIGPIAVGSGKCLGIGTPVLRFDGTITSVENIREGDQLMGPDSRPRNVLSTTEGVGPLYQVKPIKGASWVCNDAHMLTLVDSVTSAVRDVSVKEFLQENKSRREESKLFIVGVDFAPAETLPLDPYFLGVWFGDGTKGQNTCAAGSLRLRNISISKPDPEIRALVKDIAERFDLLVRETKITPERSCPTFFLSRKEHKKNTLLDIVQDLVGPHIEIPHSYLTASRLDRAAFLAGFLDTDGCLSGSGYEILQKRKDYADGVCFLARSLGLRATMKEKQVPNYGAFWRVHISGDCQFLPLRIQRKKAPPRLQKKNPLRTGFTLERMPIGKYYGFTLDGDGRFLLGDFTVTHNTLCSLLIPEVLHSKSAVLLVPPSVKRQLIEIDIPRYGRHFRFDTDTIHVVAYSELSSATKGDALDRYKPDLIIADEAHNLKNKQSARGKRFLRYLKENPGTRVVALSGTMTTRSVLDYQHLSEAALRKNSPLPSRWNELQDWAGALDAKPLKPMKPGALMEFCAPNEDDHRAGFRRRLVETPGVVATSESSLGTSLILDALRPEAVVPPVIEEAIKKLKNTWAIGDEELEDAMRVVAVERQLAMGFYYVWDWPNGVPDREWLQARKDWHVVVRDILRYRSKKGLDSPLLVAAAASRGELRPSEQEAWNAWARVKERPAPPTIPVWLDDFAMRRAAKIEEIGVIWTDHRAVEDWFRKHTSFPVYGAGDSRILDEKGDRTVVASIRAHGTGKNLQMWSYGLVLSPPANGQKLEQCLDEKTEILTNQGWVGIDDCVDGKKFAAYNIDTGVIEWSEGTKMKRVLGDEKMFGICNPHLDIRVTAGHRMVHQKRRRLGDGGKDGFYYASPVFVEASEMPRQARIPIAGLQEATGVPLTDDELIFVGLFMTDGNLSNGTISIFQSEKYPEIVELCERTVQRCGFRAGRSFITTPSNFGPRKYPLRKWCVSKGRPQKKTDRHLRGWGALEQYISKDFAPALDDMTREQLKHFLHGLWAGNGAKTVGTHAYDRYTPGTRTISFGYKLAAERIQALCVRRGFRCTLVQPLEKMWQLYISEDVTWTVTTQKMTDRRPRWTELPSTPSERVWCIEVNTGAIVTRRNGRVAIVGNCLGRHHRPGQEADEVRYDFMLHTEAQRAAMLQAINDAEYVQETTGQKQKVLYSTNLMRL